MPRRLKLNLESAPAFLRRHQVMELAGWTRSQFNRRRCEGALPVVLTLHGRGDVYVSKLRLAEMMGVGNRVLEDLAAWFKSPPYFVDQMELREVCGFGRHALSALRDQGSISPVEGGGHPRFSKLKLYELATQVS